MQAAAQVQAQAQKQKAVQKDAGKKVVVKKAPARNVEDKEEFERVADKPAAAGGRGNKRGGRGDGERRGGDRPATSGGRGERRGDGERRGGRGERRGDGERRGGRGDGERRGGGRGERRPRVDEDGNTIEGQGGRGGYRKRFDGKAREDAHPLDRQDGTGKAHRGERKGGNQRDQPARVEGEETKDAAPREEKKVREPVVVEEEEEVGYTLDDYFNDKKAKSKGVNQDTQGRKHEKIQDKVATREGEKVNVQPIANKIVARDVHKMAAGANAELLGFQAPVDEYEEGRRVNRAPRDNQREPRQGGRKGRGNKMTVNDNDFPAL